MKELIEPVIVRIPVDLKQWLTDEAASNDRSVNRELRHILQETRKQRESFRRQMRKESACD